MNDAGIEITQPGTDPESLRAWICAVSTAFASVPRTTSRSSGVGSLATRSDIVTPSALAITTSDPIEGDARPRSTRLSIEGLRPLTSDTDCSVMPRAERISLMRRPMAVSAEAAASV